MCSAWFLVDRKKSDGRKITYILADTWLISMVIFAIVMAVRRGNVERYLIEMSVLPILRDRTSLPA